MGRGSAPGLSHGCVALAGEMFCHLRLMVVEQAGVGDDDEWNANFPGIEYSAGALFSISGLKGGCQSDSLTCMGDDEALPALTLGGLAKDHFLEHQVLPDVKYINREARRDLMLEL